MGEDGYKNYSCLLTLSFTFDCLIAFSLNVFLIAPRNIPTKYNFTISYQNLDLGLDV